ncbi:MAG: fibronectin type III domain-containing protein [Leptothrix sp. (in: b-proteobacteria)]
MQRKLITTLVVAALELYAASLAQAACPINGSTQITSGPLNPVNGFSETVTDSKGVSLQLCTDPTYCFVSPVVPGNTYSAQIGTGVETFFWSANAKLQAPNGLKLVLTLATEAAFLAAEPVNGQQFQFTRLRVTMSTPVAGVYTLVHPYGVETFTVTAPTNNRDIFNTYDRGFAPNSTVTDRIGPFLKWDPAVAPAAPQIVRADGTIQQFLGDGSLLGPTHSVVGSPCGTNFVTLSVQPLAGNTPIDLDGAGNNFLTTDQFGVSGMVWDGHYQTPIASSRLTYSRAAGSLGQIDSHASSTNTAIVSVVDGPNTALGTSRLPVAQTLSSDQLGVFSLSNLLAFGPNTTDLPATLALTASEPAGANGAPAVSDPTTLIRPLVDFVKISKADYDPSTSLLTIEAASGDLRVPPTLTVREYAVAPGTPITTIAPPASVTVVSSAGGRDSAKVRVIAATAPLAPTNLAGVSNTSTSVTLTWTDASNNEDGFDIYRNGVKVGSVAANATTYTDTGLSAATAYSYLVYAVNKVGQTPSTATSVTTKAAIVPPQLTSILANPAKTVTLSWADQSLDETGFQVLRSTSAAGPFAVVASPLANATSAADTSAAAGTTYFYQVVAVRGTETSLATSGSLTTPAVATAPSKPTTSAAASGTSVTVSWTDSNGANKTGFQVMRSTAGGAFVAVGGVQAATATSYTDTTVAGTAYVYRVDVINWAGTTASPVSTSVTTPGATPPAVTLLAPTGLAATSVRSPVLSWTDQSTGETAYRVTRAPVTVNVNGSITVGTASTVTVPANSTNLQTVTDTGATRDTVYQYSVMALNGTTVGAAATIGALTTNGGLVAPGTPTLARTLVGTVPNQTARVTLTWTLPNPNTAVGGYEVQRCAGTACTSYAKVNGSAVNSAGTVDGRASASFVDNTVARGTVYRYRLRAVGGSNLGISSGFSATSTVTTQ